MLLALTIVLFLSIALAVFSFGAAAYAPSSVIGSRLRSLTGGQKDQQPERPAFKERLEQAMDPLSKALPLSASEVSRSVVTTCEVARFNAATDRARIVVSSFRHPVPALEGTWP